MAQETHLQHPRFGFSEQRIVDQVLTEVSLSGTTTLRPAGTRFALVVAGYTLNASSGTVQVLVEGSNDGSNWHTIGSTSSSENFTGSGTIVLNSTGLGLVDLQRFKYCRTRAVIVSGTPDFDLRTLITAISDDSEALLKTASFTRSGATPATQNGDLIIRPSGTLLTNVQVVATGVVLDGVTAFDVDLQGSPDGGTTWLTISTVAVAGNGSSLMAVNGETLFSLGAYQNLRFRVVDDGAAGGSAAFTISCLMGLDSADWTREEDEAAGSSFDAAAVFIQVDFGTPTAEVGNARTIGLQLLNSDGSPLLSARKLELILYDTALAGVADLSTNATFTAITTGTAVAGLTTNRLVVITSASGVANVTVTDLAAETVFITGINHDGPQTVAQYIALAEQASLVFA